MTTNANNGYNNGKIKLPFHALNDWYKSTFEMMGWMILSAKADKNKTEDYGKGIKDLIKAIDDNIPDFTSDKQRDLKIMKQTLEILLEHVDKYINAPKTMNATTGTGVATGGAKKATNVPTKRASKGKARSRSRGRSNSKGRVNSRGKK
jgi:hypothetical protein